mgnify:CR=1 FL=1
MLFIHIWCPKTGTTTLQDYIFPNIKKIDYSSDFNKKKLYILLNSYINNKKIDKKYVFDYFKTYIKNSNSNIFLISDETLVINHSFLHWENYNMKDKADRLLKLYQYISDLCDINILISIRNQKKILPSFYAQMWWYNLKYNKFIDLILKEKNFDYYYITNYYSKLFGKNNLNIWLMEEIFKDTNLWLDKLSWIMEINNKEKILKIIQNSHSNKRNLWKSTYSIYKLWIFKKILLFIYRKTFWKNNKTIWKQPMYIQKIASISKYILRLFPHKTRLIKLEYTSKQKEKIYKAYSQWNKILEKEFWLDLKSYNYY